MVGENKTYLQVEISEEISRLAKAHAALLNLKLPDYIEKLISDATKSIKKELVL